MLFRFSRGVFTMKRLVVVASLGAVFAACVADIPQTAQSTYVIALFDPSQSVVPTPTILAYDPVNNRLAVPLADTASPAQREFVTFLNSLDGYPEDTPGKVSFSDSLTPASVNANSVLIFDGTTGAPIAGATAVLDPAGAKQISILPPPTGWPAGKVIAVALVAGDNGLKGSGGLPVVGSAVWGLVKSTSPLVTGCDTLLLPDRTPNPACQPTVSVIPSNETDPAARLQDQSRSAVLLEEIRLVTNPILTALEAKGIPRDNVPLAWTFPVTTRPQVTFDPARSIIPFPNNILRTTVLSDGGVRVSLPIPDAGTLPDGGVPDIVQLYTGLNTLDGFSTTAPLVSVFNADDFGALNQGKIDAGSLTPGASWGIRFLDGTPGHARTAPNVRACLDCASSLLPDGGTPSHPQRLQFVPNVPLDERTTYGVYLTTNVTDTSVPAHNVIPSSAFALLRSENPLYDGTHSSVDLITDDQASQLELLRQALKPFITAVANAVGGRSNIALAWAFTTQTEVTALAEPNGLHRLPAFLGGQFPAQFPANPIFLVRTSPTGPYRGEIITPQVLNGPGGTLSPGNPTPKKVPVSLQVPATAPCPVPVNGYEVTIFGHGLTRSHADGLVLAPALTASPFCQVVIATDAPWHGDRSFCPGSLAFLQAVLPTATSDDDACRDPALGRLVPGKCDQNPASESFGRCIAVNPASRAPCTSDQTCSDPSLRQGLCLSDGFCEGGDFKRGTDLLLFDTTPLISGWNLINTNNLFTTRDNFRQQVVDLAQLTRVITATGPGSLNDRLCAMPPCTFLDTSRINYAGMSLGGILGTLFTSVAPDVHNVVLNTTGGDPANILLLARRFTPQRNAFLATLAGQGIHPGEIAFDTFIGIAKWILDPADPLNMIFSVRNGPSVPIGSRNALIQYITVDEVVPNETTLELITAANDRTGTFDMVDVSLFSPTETEFPPACTPDGVCNPSVPSRHGFLLQSPATDPI